MKAVLTPQGVHAPRDGAYSHAIAAGGLLFIAGQVPLDEEGRLVGRGDVRGQARQVFENLRAILQTAGLGFESLVSCTIFIVDMERNYAPYAEVRAEYFGDVVKPAMAIVEVGRLVHKDFLFELQAVAAAPDPEGSHVRH